MKKAILKWELVGFFVIVIIGTLLHFTFELSGNWIPLAPISAVNESVWEHLKIGFWPALFYAIIEYFYFRKRANNIVLAKSMGVFAIPVFIAMVFYTYNGIFGVELFIADILIFIAAIAFGQFISYRLLTSGKTFRFINWIGIVVVIALAILFVLYTFHPPDLPIFQDPVTGSYGIIH
jgi:hypothetical protein